MLCPMCPLTGDTGSDYLQPDVWAEAAVDKNTESRQDAKLPAGQKVFRHQRSLVNITLSRNMIRLVLRVVINSFSIWIASLFIEGFHLEGSVIQILLVGLVFGLVNGFIKPFLSLISAPLIVLTLGIFTLILNTLLLILTEWLMGLFTDSPVLVIDGFFAAFLASIIISLVSWGLSLLLGD